MGDKLGEREFGKGNEVTAEASAMRSLVKEVASRYEQAQAWDEIKARDLDPDLLEYVRQGLAKGKVPSELMRELGLKQTGRDGRPWKKIQAALRQGFRADAELYIVQQSTKLFRAIENAKETLEDAFENGTPHVITHEVGHEVIRVKGATKELAGFLKAYTEALAMPIKLWKEYGAIGEKNDAPKQLSIVVKNMISFPTAEAIEAHRDELIAKSKAIEVEGKKV